jgi:DHA2 family multidrug resistance protein
MTHAGKVVDKMVAGGVSHQAAVEGLTGLVEGQSVMLSTLNMFGDIALVMMFAACLIWIAPKPKGPIDTSAAH